MTSKNLSYDKKRDQLIMVSHDRAVEILLLESFDLDDFVGGDRGAAEELFDLSPGL